MGKMCDWPNKRDGVEASCLWKKRPFRSRTNKKDGDLKVHMRHAHLCYSQSYSLDTASHAWKVYKDGSYLIFVLSLSSYSMIEVVWVFFFFLILEYWEGCDCVLFLAHQDEVYPQCWRQHLVKVFAAVPVSKLLLVLSSPNLHEWCIWAYLWT